MSNYDAINQALYELGQKYSSYVVSEDNTLEDNITAILAKGIRKCSPGLSSKEFKEEAMERVMNIDATLPHDSCAAIDYGSFELNTIFNRVRGYLHKFFRGFTPDFKDAWLSPGETYLPAFGDVSMLSKLSTTWTVTPEAYELGVELMLSNRQIRRDIAKDVRATGLGAKAEFNELLLKRFELVRGSRFSAVPKDESKMRGIEVQPMVNLMLQRCFHTWTARRLESWGFPLETATDRHRELLYRTDVRTIDARDASDSISMRLVRDLFPTDVVSFIDRTRPTACRWGKDDESFRPLRKVSGMGSYITFALMTVLLLAICEASGASTYSVFGDDVICDDKSFDTVCKAMCAAGFRINYDKTFALGIVRESCGHYVVRETPILRYDFTWCEDDLDLVFTLNKGSRLVREYDGFNLSIIADLKQILGSVDGERLPQGPVLPDLSPWVEVSNPPEVPDRVLSLRYQLPLNKVTGLVRKVTAVPQDSGGYLAYTIVLRTLSRPTLYNVRRIVVKRQTYIWDTDSKKLLGTRQSMKREINFPQEIEHFQTNYLRR